MDNQEDGRVVPTGLSQAEPQEGLGPTGFDPSRKCLTPEARYSVGSRDSGLFGADGRRVLVVEVRFPFEITDWVEGNAAIADTPEGVDPLSDADRLRRYDERATERRRISNLVHDQMEAVGADCYRVLLERDARIGEDRVDYGIRHARWRRTREGGRPVPAHEPEDHWSRRIGFTRDSDGSPKGGDACGSVHDSAGRQASPSPTPEVHMSEIDPVVVAKAALEAWRALPDDERNGERPFIMGFNAGWDEALKVAAEVARQTKAYDDATQKGAGCLTTGERIAIAILEKSHV